MKHLSVVDRLSTSWDYHYHYYQFEPESISTTLLPSPNYIPKNTVQQPSPRISK
jgi:hypothetical protein